MASGNMKVIKRRIKSVGSTMQITKAMELVASSKLRKAKQRAENARPFFETQYELVCEIAAENNLQTIFNSKRPIKNRLLIVIAGDRGLAGGYNSNVLKLASNAYKDDENKPKIIAIGKKSVEYFKKRGYDMIGEYPELAENMKTADCGDIANTAVDMFKNGEIDSVSLFYTMFVSPLVQTATELPVLPLDAGADTARTRTSTYDPSPEAVFSRVIPKYILSLIHCAVVESYASEQGARRTAMENATDNAEEMIANLSLKYNRARQEKITNEINEIVGGANAL